MRKLTPIAVVCTAITVLHASVAQAAPVLHSRGMAAQASGGGIAGNSTLKARGEHGALAARRGVAADRQGNVAAGRQGGFATESGAYGARTGKFNRSADGAVSASSHSQASGANGSAERSGSFTRGADGSASGERSTTATNAITGVNFDGYTTYSKGSGVSRSASCTDAAGNSDACLSR